MDPIRRRELEELDKPPLFWRIFYRFRFGKDSYCDICGHHTWWNGIVESQSGVDLVMCNYCSAIRAVIAQRRMKCQS